MQSKLLGKQIETQTSVGYLGAMTVGGSGSAREVDSAWNSMWLHSWHKPGTGDHRIDRGGKGVMDVVASRRAIRNANK